MTPALCILTAGRGSRLGELTASVNKSLLPIANQAAISHSIQKLPKECEIVVAVGYDKEKVIEYCQAAHPDRPFIFVEVDKLDGPGAGPGYSLLCCEAHLQRPFYLCNADTVVTQPYMELDCNWIGVAETDTPHKYCTVQQEGIGTRLIDKSPEGTKWAYIGLAGIYHWADFWTALREGHGSDPEYQYVAALEHLGPLRLYGYSWMDTGSVEGYEAACRRLGSDQVLGMEKVINELTYKVEGRLVKLCWEAEKNAKRIRRAELLQGLVPELVYKGDYTSAYDWVEGRPLAQVENVGVFHRFLDWCQEKLWSEIYDVPNWSDATFAFYHDKTFERIEQYLRLPFRAAFSCPKQINGVNCRSLTSLLYQIDWKWLTTPRMVKFHGDLQFDNVILSGEDEFVLIDWRECFGSSPLYGDVYYDLAKLYNDLELPYNLIKRRKFELHWSNLGWADYSYSVPSNLNNFRVYFERWMRSQGYELQKVKLLAALVPLNMAPLHPDPYRDLLFFHSVQRLNTLLG